MLGETIKTLQKKSHLVCDFFYKQKISCLERDVSFLVRKSEDGRKIIQKMFLKI